LRGFCQWGRTINTLIATYPIKLNNSWLTASVAHYGSNSSVNVILGWGTGTDTDHPTLTNMTTYTSTTNTSYIIWQILGY